MSTGDSLSPLQEGQQGPIDIVGKYKALGMNLSLEANCGRAVAVPAGGTHGTAAVLLGAAAEEASQTAVAYVGGHQVSCL